MSVIREYPGSSLLTGDTPKWDTTPRGVQRTSADLTTTGVSTGRLGDARTNFESSTQYDDAVTALTKQGKAPLPFVIGLGQHKQTISYLTNRITLLVPPSSFSLSSSQVSAASMTRNGMTPTLWGASQPVIALQGKSPAFITAGEGLVTASATSANAVTMKDSLGYRHFMTLVAMFKSNGYQRLLTSEDPLLGDENLPGQTSRVIHVLDCVHIQYDGTEYYGHFTDLSFTYESSSPYHFSYSMNFTVSGIKGDFVRGHIGDGSNQKSGIIIGDNAGVLASNIVLNTESLQVRAAGDAGAARAREMAAAADESVAPVDGAFGGFDSSGGLLAAGSQAAYNEIPSRYRTQFDAFLREVQAKGYTIYLNSCIRPGNPHSRHFWGGAIDIQVIGPGTNGLLPNAMNNSPPGKTHTDAVRDDTIKRWEATGIPGIARRLNLRWGGDFKDEAKGDCVHFEVTDERPADAGGAANKGPEKAEGTTT